MRKKNTVSPAKQKEQLQQTQGEADPSTNNHKYY